MLRLTRSFVPSPHGVGTPIDFSRACARPARAFIPSRYVLTSFPGRFSTLQTHRPRGPVWMPITPKTGSLFHADPHPERGKSHSPVAVFYHRQAEMP